MRSGKQLRGLGREQAMAADASGKTRTFRGCRQYERNIEQYAGKSEHTQAVVKQQAQQARRDQGHDEVKLSSGKVRQGNLRQAGSQLPNQA